jgi:hypothetical protein
MDSKNYAKWSEQLDAGEYGEFTAIEANPYFQIKQDVERTLLPVIEIAKRNNISIADLTKTLVSVGYKEGLTPA